MADVRMMRSQINQGSSECASLARSFKIPGPLEELRVKKRSMCADCSQCAIVLDAAIIKHMHKTMNKVLLHLTALQPHAEAYCDL